VFIIGCLGLPWLWIANVLYLSDKIENPIYLEAKRWYQYSFYGSIVVLVLFIAWIVTFQLMWVDWKAYKLLIWIPPNIRVGW
jgi:hypothetical protein